MTTRSRLSSVSLSVLSLKLSLAAPAASAMTFMLLYELMICFFLFEI